MNIRKLEESDIPEVRKIYDEHYSNLEFPDFLNKFLGSFIIIDDDTDKIITAGGIRLIPEVVILTDKKMPVKIRREALYKVLDASDYITGRSGFDRLYATTKDGTWLKHLKKVGFHSRGEFLVLDL